jgi:hypothetical protein
MPNSHARSADAQQKSIATKQSDSTVKRRMNILELCTECQLLQPGVSAQNPVNESPTTVMF